MKYPINLFLEAVLRAPALAFAEADPYSGSGLQPSTTGAPEKRFGTADCDERRF
jgi:hypothetical protein